MRKIALFVFLVFTSAMIFDACKHEAEPQVSVDTQLYNMATETSGFTWYKFSDTFLGQSSQSGHQESFLRTRYNDIAANHLDGDGKVQSGITFDEGSLIVKELINNGTEVATYAVMYKKPNHEFADADGWVWGYIYGDGSTRISASEKGQACRSCHSQNGHIDFTLMNLAFP
jgi:hypothetical protein